MNMKTKMTKLKFALAKKAPDIEFWGGLGGLIASGILACRATVKASKDWNEAKEKLEGIKAREEDELYGDCAFLRNDAKLYKRDIYISTGKKLCKTYAIPFGLGVASTVSLCGSHLTMKKRNVKAIGECTALLAALNNAKEKIKSKYGEEEVVKMFNNIEEVEIEETEVDEKGKEKKKKKKINVINVEPSIYSRFFDETCDGWDPDPNITLQVLKAKERWANDQLRVKKYMFLNDVYAMLGLPPSDVGQDVGWIFDADNDAGDNYISFGIFGDLYRPNQRFVNGYEEVCLLDFNVDGNIREKFMKYV